MTHHHFLFAAALLLPSTVNAAVYSAAPLTPASAKKIIQRDVSWACGPAACQGATDYGRPLVLCQRLAREVGALGSFLVDGRALPPAELDRCNAVVRGAAPTLARAN